MVRAKKQGNYRWDKGDLSWDPTGPPDKHYPSDGPGSLLDRRDKDINKPRGGYPSDKQFPSGPVPLAKKKKKKKTRTA